MKPGKLITVGVPLVVTAGFLAICWLGWQRVVADQSREVGYTEQERRQLAALLTPSKPVELWKRKKAAPSTKGGYAVYDSKIRAEIIGLVWNVTPQNMDAFKRWGF